MLIDLAFPLLQNLKANNWLLKLNPSPKGVPDFPTQGLKLQALQIKPFSPIESQAGSDNNL